MQGQGNDFVMLNGVTQPFKLTSAHIRQLADRHFGIGCDQVLLVEPSVDPSADFRYRIFNADGGEVEQCGNGARCFAVFVRDQGLTTKHEIRVATLSGIVTPRIEGDGTVSVDMGPPHFDPIDIPFLADAYAAEYALEVDGTVRRIAALSMGNPHAVQIVDDIDLAPLATEGPQIEHHPRFPRRVNVGFMQILTRTHIRLRVWERGAGETLACGTGACAAVVTGITWNRLDAGVAVQVSTRGGDLWVTWQGDNSPVIMSGAATTVYHGEINL